MRHAKQNCTFNINNAKVRGILHSYTRGGSESPELFIFEINGKRYTPYAAKKFNISVGITDLFRYYYGNTLNNF